MRREYEIDELEKEQSWRMFRIIGELVEGFDRLSNLGHAVTVYGSARTHEDDPHYAQAREIGRRLGEAGYAVVTGGGAGIMEAANRGAFEAGAISVGINIELPGEQQPNRYTTRSLSFNHFFARRVMLVKYATAFVVMPGGLGTLDELTEVLTLMQTGKTRPFPVIMFDSGYWEGFIAWMRAVVLGGGFISADDCAVLRLSDDPIEVVEIVKHWDETGEIIGRPTFPVASAPEV